MTDKTRLKQNLVALATFVTGLVTLASTLVALVRTHHVRIVVADAHFTVLAGLSLIYLAMLLRRGKHNAWLLSLGVYTFLIIRNIQHFAFDEDLRFILPIIFNIVLPLLVIAALVAWRPAFKVKSSFLSFGLALRSAAIILLVAFLYGLVGFQLFDTRDFHQEIGTISAAHYTIDQFGLTTNNHPTAYTKRAVAFSDSLAAVSIASVFYVAAAFFAPVRFRLSHNQRDRLLARDIMLKHSSTSEDFFKLWPGDKAYFFNAPRSAFIAYKVTRGVALSVGDPAGPASELKELVQDFKNYAYFNGWAVAFIHTEAANSKLFKSLDFDAQKIGQEALVNINKFCAEVAKDKYFRQINNRFVKNGYSCELLKSPHSSQLISRLRQISNDWQEVPGRNERGFMMGYFSEAYMQASDIFVAKNNQGQIEAFLNQVASPKAGEANYDLLRAAKEAPGNINDFLMVSFIDHLKLEGFEKLNMGLSPLAGLGPGGDEDGLINNTLNLVYAKADRFYSFQGLTRFKNKYQPDWEDRYIIYQGGLAGFGRTMSALLKAMSR